MVNKPTLNIDLNRHSVIAQAGSIFDPTLKGINRAIAYRNSDTIPVVDVTHKRIFSISTDVVKKINNLQLTAFDGMVTKFSDQLDNLWLILTPYGLVSSTGRKVVNFSVPVVFGHDVNYLRYHDDLVLTFVKYDESITSTDKRSFLTTKDFDYSDMNLASSIISSGGEETFNPSSQSTSTTAGSAQADGSGDDTASSSVLANVRYSSESERIFFEKFAEILAFRIEGGVVELPGDSGGRTICGITTKYHPQVVAILEQKWQQAERNPRIMRELVSLIGKLYYSKYSNKTLNFMVQEGLDELASFLLACKIWGTPGKISAAKFQYCLNKASSVHGLGFKLVEDGILGNKSFEAVRKALPHLKSDYGNFVASFIQVSAYPLIQEIDRLIDLYKSRGVSHGFADGFSARLIKSYTLLLSDALRYNIVVSRIMYSVFNDHMKRFNISQMGKHLTAEQFAVNGCNNPLLCNMRTVGNFNFKVKGNKFIV